VNWEKSPILGAIRPARKPLSSCGSAAASFWVSGTSSLVWVTAAVAIAESIEKGDRPSLPPLAAESLSISGGRFDSV
jgi:hypothetical protein